MDCYSGTLEDARLTPHFMKQCADCADRPETSGREMRCLQARLEARLKDEMNAEDLQIYTHSTAVTPAVNSRECKNGESDGLNAALNDGFSPNAICQGPEINLSMRCTLAERNLR